jgi:hypothetical protein
MSGTVQANDGTMLPLDSIPVEIDYSGSFVSKMTVEYQGKIFVQTFTNDGTNIIYISGWELNTLPPSDEIMIDQSGNIMTDQSGVIMVSQ